MNYFYDLQLADGGTLRLSSKEEINKYTLNPENPIPEMAGNITWVSNYVLTYWLPLMKPDAFVVYLQLLKLAFGTKEYAYPTVGYLAETTGLSRRTVQRVIKILIDLNFVVVIHVKDTRTNSNAPNLYLLSRTVPFLTERQLAELPERLQESHKKFIEKTKYRSIFE